MQQKLNYWITEFERIYNGSNWIGESLIGVAGDLPATIAFQIPPGNRHSIAGILKHMMAYKYLLISRLSGDNIYDVDQEKSFDVSSYDEPNENGLKKLLSDVDDCQSELMKLLNHASDDVLGKPVAGRDYTIEYLINGIVQHDIYHLGQLAFLKKQLFDVPA